MDRIERFTEKVKSTIYKNKKDYTRIISLLTKMKYPGLDSCITVQEAKKYIQIYLEIDSQYSDEYQEMKTNFTYNEVYSTNFLKRYY